MEDEQCWNKTWSICSSNRPAIQAFVRLGREKFTREFSGDQHCFDAIAWDVRGFRDRPTAQSHVLALLYLLWHIRPRASTDLCEVIKSWIILNGDQLATCFTEMQ